MEVTLDSTDWLEVLGKLRRRLPADVLLGVGTVMDESATWLVTKGQSQTNPKTLWIHVLSLSWLKQPIP